MDAIDAVTDTDLDMPDWAAFAVKRLTTGQTKTGAMRFCRRWEDAISSPEWRSIDWAKVRAAWMEFVVRQAQEAAAQADADAAEVAKDTSKARNLRFYESAANSAARNARNCRYAAAFANAAETTGRAASDAAFEAAEAYLNANWHRPRRRFSWADACAAQADALMAAIERAMEVA